MPRFAYKILLFSNIAVTSRKSSNQPSGDKMVAATTTEADSTQTNANGDTIRIFRRSRSGRPGSAQSGMTTEDDEAAAAAATAVADEKMLRIEDLPAPDSSAGIREDSTK
jgi:hypothetical protein